MSPDPIYVSFATPDYREHMARLAASLVEFGLDAALYHEPDMGWRQAQAMKASKVWEALRTFRPRPVVWIDADAIVRKRPDLFHSFESDLGFDLCAHSYRGGRELLSGTVYFPNHRRAETLVNQWEQACIHSPNVWDQMHLKRIVESGGYRLRQLPASYVQIFDTMKDEGEPVIEHFQASREKKMSQP